MQTKYILMFGACLAMLLGASCFVGCEDDPDTDGVGDYFDNNPIDLPPRDPPADVDMVISPETEMLPLDGDVASFRVLGGRAPYVWGTYDISRGTILSFDQTQAVYQRASAGDNVVICQDSQGVQAYATVIQP